MSFFANSSGTLCPYCEPSLKSTNFELIKDRPAGSADDYQYYYMRCSTCKKFVSILPSHRPDIMLQKLIEHFKLR